MEVFGNLVLAGIRPSKGSQREKDKWRMMALYVVQGEINRYYKTDQLIQLYTPEVD